MHDWERMLWIAIAAEQREVDKLLFYAHYKSDYEFLKACGIAWPISSP
ncbi:hypothetical protein LCGC14_2767520 [marine sediment metagenome]|uniref:Uncharacterized protein n=1 Tax=marine sediment metagenome TaxID=412755 RepID=A0A0F8YX37_9ZZZZ